MWDLGKFKTVEKTEKQKIFLKILTCNVNKTPYLFISVQTCADILTLPLSWHIAQKILDSPQLHMKNSFSYSQMWTTGGEQCSQVHLHTQITGT